MTMINATEDEIRAVAEVLKFAAILDDRAPGPDKARIGAWAEQVHRHQLGRDDLIDGLQAFYDTPHDRAITIGDLITQARAVRRDRCEREGSDHGEPAAGDAIGSIGPMTFGPVSERTNRLDAAEYGLQTCFGKRDSIAAIREYFAAKAQAQKARA